MLLCFDVAVFFLLSNLSLMKRSSSSFFLLFFSVPGIFHLTADNSFLSLPRSYSSLFVFLVFFILLLSFYIILFIFQRASFILFSPSIHYVGPIDFIFELLAGLPLSHKPSELPHFQTSIDHYTANHNQSPPSVIMCCSSFVVCLSCIVSSLRILLI